MIQDRRSSGSRVTHICEAQLEGLRNAADTVRVSDLSPSGAFLDTRVAMPVGAATRLTFRIEKTEITVTAKIAYCVPSIGMGVEFVDLNPEHRALIEVLKRKHARRQ